MPSLLHLCSQADLKRIGRCRSCQLASSNAWAKMATNTKSIILIPPTHPVSQGEGNCYTHSPLFFSTMPWAMRYKTRPPAPRVKVDAHTCVLLLFRSCVECGIGTIPSRNAGDRMPRMGIFTVPLTYQHTFTQIRKRARTHMLHGSRACTASHRPHTAACLYKQGGYRTTYTKGQPSASNI